MHRFKPLSRKALSPQPLLAHPQVPLPSEKQIQRLEEELFDARQTIIKLMPLDKGRILRSYLDCKTRTDTHGWQEEVAYKLIDLANVLPVVPDWPNSDRAFCPLCGMGSSTPYESGFSIPEGLRRHLLGFGSVKQCVVVATAFHLARDYWNRQFREGEHAEREQQARRIAERRKIETLYQVTPDAEAQLLDDSSVMGRHPRTESEMAWAEQRLTNLGFHIAEENQVKTYTDEQETFITYADPRYRGQIAFNIYQLPLPQKAGRRKGPMSKRGSFYLRDEWKLDLHSKYEARVSKAIANWSK